jgi:uncharacterized protein YhbP (UPF0306 family)
MNDLAQKLRALLAEASTLALATVDPAGHPHAANLNFVADERASLYFISHPDSDHSRHVAADPRIAAALYPPFSALNQIRGVQLRGDCRLTDLADFDRIWSLYVAKFPYGASLEQRARAERFYVVHPNWVRVIDNSVRFGFKIEANWP